MINRPQMVKLFVIDYIVPCFYLSLRLVCLPKIIHQQDVTISVNVWNKNHWLIICRIYYNEFCFSEEALRIFILFVRFQGLLWSTPYQWVQSSVAQLYRSRLQLWIWATDYSDWAIHWVSPLLAYTMALWVLSFSDIYEDQSQLIYSLFMVLRFYSIP
jgi:hypothetical protein